MTTIEEIPPAYEVDVDFPEVNGLEHLQMLLARSELHSSGHLLEKEQKGAGCRAVGVHAAPCHRQPAIPELT